MITDSDFDPAGLSEDGETDDEEEEDESDNERDAPTPHLPGYVITLLNQPLNTSNTLLIRMDHYFWPKFAKLDPTH